MAGSHRRCPLALDLDLPLPAKTAMPQVVVIMTNGTCKGFCQHVLRTAKDQGVRNCQPVQLDLRDSRFAPVVRAEDLASSTNSMGKLNCQPQLDLRDSRFAPFVRADIYLKASSTNAVRK